MLGPLSPPPPPHTSLGREKTVRSASPPLIQCRLSHDKSCFCVSIMNLLYSETSFHVMLRNEMSMLYWVVVGDGGGRVASCSINVIVLIS